MYSICLSAWVTPILTGGDDYFTWAFAKCLISSTNTTKANFMQIKFDKFLKDNRWNEEGSIPKEKLIMFKSTEE